MRTGTTLACAVVAACGSAASAGQTLHLDFTAIGGQGQRPGAFSPFTGLQPAGPRFAVANNTAFAAQKSEGVSFRLPDAIYSGALSTAAIPQLGDADFTLLGIDYVLAATRTEDLVSFAMPRQSASFFSSKESPVLGLSGHRLDDRELFVHAVPLPPSVYAAGGLLLGMALVRARRLRT